MEYQLKLKPRAEKELEKLPKHHQHRVKSAMFALRSDPYSGKKLDGEYDGQYSFRIWPYRIIYILEKKIVTVTIVSIGHRKDVYKKLKR